MNATIKKSLLQVMKAIRYSENPQVCIQQQSIPELLCYLPYLLGFACDTGYLHQIQVNITKPMGASPLLHHRKKVSVSCDPGNYAKKKIFSQLVWKMASTSYSAVKVLDLLDTDSSDSGSSGEEGDDI